MFDITADFGVKSEINVTKDNLISGSVTPSSVRINQSSIGKDSKIENGKIYKLHFGSTKMTLGLSEAAFPFSGDMFGEVEFDTLGVTNSHHDEL